MTAGIVGLGLIGGSMAKAYKAADWTVYVSNRTTQTADFAVLAGAADGILDETTIPMCDLLLITVYPDSTVAWLEKNKQHIAAHTVVIDCCGIKKTVCEKCFAIAASSGFEFVGGHPMAGTQFSGFKYSFPTLFNGAPMVLVPKPGVDMEYLSRVKALLAPAGFGHISVTTAEEHDRLIAFTSQMAHIVSNAFIKSPTARSHKGFSAGSYRDLTRVAWLNETMWTELFLENRENLIFELDTYIKELTKYKEALEQQDADRLKSLLAEGRKIKEEVDGVGDRKR
ncbi:MAG: prephenate dehydrogenase/arogenate dehydrogenase family protein [Clostridia bacterium]|nr:prephenate dehydrogenase/arogenate dehydrogenase family protein [Clostridia bacterium]